ncbi:hypothetical protein MMC18_006301 [Xylographa bjoerkii]|nr:hypothetical protein [Xylographa bjoerkii]
MRAGLTVPSSNIHLANHVTYTSSQAAMVPTASYTTAVHPMELGWSDSNLPNCLFQLEPSDDFGAAKYEPLKDSRDLIIVDARRRDYKDFDFLPSQISIRPEDWRLEAYTDRLHPGCGTRDIYYRMILKVDGNGMDEKLLSGNAINMRKVRFRNEFNIPCWKRRMEQPPMVECLILEQFSYGSLIRNTVAPVTATHILKPSMAGYPPVLLPLDAFTGSLAPYQPSEKLCRNYELLAELEDLAFDKGYAHWIFLENKYKPKHWITKAQGQRHPHTGSNEISVPRTEAMPTAAVKYIEACIREAFNGQGFLPPVAQLPAHTRVWVRSVINNIPDDETPSSPINSSSSPSRAEPENPDIGVYYEENTQMNSFSGPSNTASEYTPDQYERMAYPSETERLQSKESGGENRDPIMDQPPADLIGCNHSQSGDEDTHFDTAGEHIRDGPRYLSPFQDLGVDITDAAPNYTQPRSDFHSENMEAAYALASTYDAESQSGLQLGYSNVSHTDTAPYYIQPWSNFRSISPMLASPPVHHTIVDRRQPSSQHASVMTPQVVETMEATAVCMEP